MFGIELLSPKRCERDELHGGLDRFVIGYWLLAQSPFDLSSLSNLLGRPFKLEISALDTADHLTKLFHLCANSTPAGCRCGKILACLPMHIPKLAHHIWLGGQPLHPLMKLWLAKWISLNPSWHFLLWREGDRFEELTCGDIKLTTSASDLLARACHLSQRANIWRYEIVRQLGGLYLDTDMEPFKPIDGLIDDVQAFVVRGTRRNQVVYETAFFGAIPHHPLLNTLVAELPTRDPSITLSLGVDYFTPIVQRTSGVTVIESNLVLFPHPKDWAPNSKCTPQAAELQPPPEAYAIHRWSSVWSPTGFQAIDAPVGWSVVRPT